MYDRLLFLTVQNRSELLSITARFPKLVSSSTEQLNSFSTLNEISRSRRLKRKPIPQCTGPHEIWDYKMLVTDEVNQLLNLNEQQQNKKQNLFKSSLDFM